MNLVKKWVSRKLLVAIVAVVAIAMSIQKGDPAVEGEVISKGTIIVDSLIALLGAVYIIIQGIIDKNKPDSL